MYVTGIKHEEAKEATRWCMDEAKKEWREQFGDAGLGENHMWAYVAGCLRDQLKAEMILSGRTAQRCGISVARKQGD